MCNALLCERREIVVNHIPLIERNTTTFQGVADNALVVAVNTGIRERRTARWIRAEIALLDRPVAGRVTLAPDVYRALALSTNRGRRINRIVFLQTSLTR